MLAALIATRNTVSILTTSLPDGSVGIPYSALLLGIGGFMPYTWAVISGSLPPGLTLNSSTGNISGIPTTPGTFTFTIQLTDAHGTTAMRVLTITVLVVLYGNQFVAATTTFTCITLAKQAAAISANPSFSYQLLFSTQANPSLVSQLEQAYYRIVNYLSSNANIIQMPSNVYLSNQIIAVIEAATVLNGIIQALPVATVNTRRLVDIQTRMGIALRLLLSLAIPITLNLT
jgi:Putative Ig domain